MTVQKTWTPKGAEAAAQRKWWVVDAEGMTLGRISTVVARILRGKNKPNFTPHMDIGDFVVIINAEKIVVTGKKASQIMYYRHSNYPGGFRETPYLDMLRRHPTAPLEKAIRGMLPHNNLGDQLYRKLHVYAGPTHPHAAQNPEVYVLTSEETGQNS